MADRYASLKQGLVGCWIPSVSGSGLLLPDLSGRGNNGALTNMDASDWVSSGDGRALDFDGSNDEVRITLNSLANTFNSNLFSFALWANVRSFSNSPVLVSSSRLDEASSDDFLIETNNNGSILYVKTADGAIGLSGARTYTLTSTLTTNNWFHVAFLKTGSGNNGRLFVNGIEQTSFTGSLQDSIVVDFQPLRLGIYSGGIVPLNGQLDDIRLYSRALTEAEIKLLASDRGIGFKPNKKLSRFSQRFTYKPDKPRNYSVIRNRDADTSSLKHGLVAAYCPSISGQGNVLPDLVGGNHGTLTNMDASDWVSSGDGRALRINRAATRDQVNFGNVCHQPNDFSISFFVNKIATGSTAYQNLWAVTRWNTGASMGTNEFCCLLTKDSTGTGDEPSFVVDVAGTGYRVESSAGLRLGFFDHVCCVRLADTLSIYVNGINRGITTGVPTTAIANNSRNLKLGDADIASTDLNTNAMFDDIRVYNRALSEPEIKLLASKRGIGLEPRKPKITFTDLGVQKAYSVVRVKETDHANLRQGLVGAWCPSLPNGGSGNTLPDVSGNNNHGSLVNMGPEDWVSGQYGRALDFDGTNDYVNFGSNINLAGFKSISYSAWVFRATLGQITPFARYVNTSGLGANRRADNFTVTTYTTAGQVYCGVAAATVSGLDYIEFYSTETIVANQWNHIAAALFINGNSSSGKIWINGKSATVNIVYSGTPPTEFAPNVSTGLYTINRFIGGNSVAVYNSGIVDDVRAYNRRITDSEASLLASRPGIGLRQESHRNTFYQFPSFQPALARRSSAIIGGGIT